jgi:hypothetical protein
MTGAYCLDCREEGPDLLITPPDLLLGRARISFTCGRCGTRWLWTVTIIPGVAPRYDDPQRAPVIH